MAQASAVQLKATAPRLTAQDASFLYGESLHGPMHIGSLCLFDGPIDVAAVREQVEGRLHLVPRYRQKLGTVPWNLNHATWEDDTNFSIERHIFGHELPEGTTIEQMTERAMELHEPVLDRARPLWEMHIFNGLTGNRSAMLWKIHHCLVDGVSGIELSTVIMDFEPEAAGPEAPEQPWEPSAPADPVAAVTAAVIDLYQVQLDAARDRQEILRHPELVADRATLFATASRTMMEMATRPVVNAPWNRPPVTFRRRLAWIKMPFGEVRGIRGVLGGTVNDVVLEILSEGAARYLRDHGVNLRGQSMRIGCPVNVRRESESGALGNRVSMMFPMLPAEPMDAVDRLNAVRKETERIKAAREPQALESLMDASTLMPPSMVAMSSAMGLASSDMAATFALSAPAPVMAPSPFALPGFGINFVATNVPGVQVPQYLAGRRMTESVGLMLLGGNLGYGVAIGSYNQEIFLGLMSEPRVMPDVELMKEHVVAAYEELKAAAMAASSA